MNINEFIKQGLGEKHQQQSHIQIGNLIWLKKEKI